MAENVEAPKYPIMGIEEGPIGYRREISAWWGVNGYEKENSLFIQALNILQDRDPEDRLSYFQLAGIHCYPIIGWDGERPGPGQTEKEYGGYCAHNRNDFPLWHRPYLALFEQVLYEIMRDEIVNKIEDPAEWANAAKRCRLPYWDWALDSKIPHVCTLPQVKIETHKSPEGELVKNPLYMYINKNSSKQVVAMGDHTMKKLSIPNNVFTDGKPHLPVSRVSEPDVLTGLILCMSRCSGTSRHGIIHGKDEKEWAPGKNDHDKVNEALKDPLVGEKEEDHQPLKDAVGRLLNSQMEDPYHEFASTKHFKGLRSNGFHSLEAIHNAIHDFVGGSDFEKGGGHMADVPVAAFDPIFWLHHCNIDRIFVQWRRLHPYTKYSVGKPDDPTWDAKLLPFHYGTKSNEYHRVKGNWNHEQFNYEYDDFEKPRTTVELVTDIKATYQTASSVVDKSDLQITRSIDGKRRYDDYVINIIYDRYALNGLAYSILFFLGDVPLPLSNYRNSKSYIGKVYTFSAPLLADGVTACDNCAQQKKEGVLSTAQITLTTPLVRFVENDIEERRRKQLEQRGPELPINPGPELTIDPWNPTALEEILRKELHVRFMDITGTEREYTDFPTTTFAVFRGLGQTREEKGQFNEFSGYKLVDVTAGHPLGWSPRAYTIMQESSDLDQLFVEDP